MRFDHTCHLRFAQRLIVVAQLLIGLAQRLQIRVELAQAFGLRPFRRVQLCMQRLYPLLQLCIGQLLFLQLPPQLGQLFRIADSFWRGRRPPLQPLRDAVQRRCDPCLQLVYLAHPRGSSLLCPAVPRIAHRAGFDQV